MKGIMLIVMLLALLVTGYLVVQDMKARQEGDTAALEVVNKADRVGEKVNRATEAQEDRIKKILGD